MVNQSLRKYLAEATGTFALVFCGTGAIIINQQSGGAITHGGIAVTFGLIVAAMIYAFAPVSGAHFNPAVSIALLAARLFPVKELPVYLIAQISGALAASYALHCLFPDNTLLGATLPAGSAMQSFVLEIILTFLLMLTILQLSQDNSETKGLAGFIIGAVVLLEAMFAGPVCGASMNPARSLAPALVSGHTEYLWLYLLAPVLGALLAVLFRRLLK